MKKRFAIIMLITMIMSIFVVNETKAYAAQSFTPCPLRGQQKSNWCWAASTQMLLETKGYNRTQSAICTYIHGQVINRGGSANNVAAAARWGSNYSLDFDLNGPLPFSGARSVVSSINNGWSIAVGCFNSDRTIGHTMVITGYDTNNSSVWLQDPQGTVNSFPAPGKETWCGYNALVSGNYSGTKFSYLNIKWLTSVN